jgi:hypothetical protein
MLKKGFPMGILRKRHPIHGIIPGDIQRLRGHHYEGKNNRTKHPLI